MKKFVIVFVIIALGASAVLYASGVMISQNSTFHYYLVPAVKVQSVKLEVLYFAPSDQAPDPQFYGLLKKALTDMQNFHIREFKGLNALRFTLYPQAVIGKEPASFYDGANTARGNPDALGRIFAETASRVYASSGDLYSAEFTQRKNGELPIRVFVYQGVGASSGVLSVIISHDYFTQTAYGATTLYHEVLHNLGVPDAYDYATDVPQSDDIMGGGRTKPIMQTYIRDEIKQRMTQ